jgi:hypothetical protein
MSHSPPPDAEVAPQAAGPWVNQNGSLLHLEVSAEGAVSGWFESRKGRAAAGRRYPVLGRANGVLVSFIVDFRIEGQDLGSITSFSGRLAVGPDGAPALHTMWILARAFEDAEHSRPTQAWNSFLVNADVFRRPEPHA